MNFSALNKCDEIVSNNTAASAVFFPNAVASRTVVKIQIVDESASGYSNLDRVSIATLSDNKHFLSPMSSSESTKELVRSTSLKSYHQDATGNDLPKKVVRFADALGLDLVNVREFVKNASPEIPTSAFIDLNIDIRQMNNSLLDLCPFMVEFQQPGSDPNFLVRVREQKVCLENVLFRGSLVIGYVRILNLGFEKQVLVRYTNNAWTSFDEVAASYVPGSSDGLTDKFAFEIQLTKGGNLSFVVKYMVNGEEFWDNNHNENYSIGSKT